MNKQNAYYKQVQLLIEVLPLIASEECFALKGGTAINLFVRELPRLSVDIDLTYVPLDNYSDSLKNIDKALGRISQGLTSSDSQLKVSQTSECKSVVRRGKIQIKIEVTPVLRGAVHPCELRSVSERTELEFGYVETQVLSFNDLYAGKICAALDRQHPRDLFDIKLLLENEGISRELFDTFIVYLISHKRPINEVLDPTRKNIEDLYDAEFKSMPEIPVTLAELIGVRHQLIDSLHRMLTDADKDFLIKFKSREPDWTLTPYPAAAQLPAVRWKLQNLKKMSDKKHAEALNHLRYKLQKISR